MNPVPPRTRTFIGEEAAFTEPVAANDNTGLDKLRAAPATKIFRAWYCRAAMGARGETVEVFSGQ
jgi:hypothetical protein